MCAYKYEDQRLARYGNRAFIRLQWRVNIEESARNITRSRVVCHFASFDKQLQRMTFCCFRLRVYKPSHFSLCSSSLSLRRRAGTKTLLELSVDIGERTGRKREIIKTSPRYRKLPRSTISKHNPERKENGESER